MLKVLAMLALPAALTAPAAPTALEVPTMPNDCCRLGKQDGAPVGMLSKTIP